MDITFYTVDAFADKPFCGNPAAVMVLENGLTEVQMQAIAAEINLSETAFVVAKGSSANEYGIRWFTPTAEVDLCGHATLASAHVLFEHYGVKTQRIIFHSASGPLPTEINKQQLLELDFPANPTSVIATPAALVEALGIEPLQVRIGGPRMLVVVASSEIVAQVTPNFAKLGDLEQRGICVTAPGTDRHSNYDFVCRYFAPAIGIPEDPVTGSAYTALVPYYAQTLNKMALSARQLSARGGDLSLSLEGNRVKIAGKAITVSKGCFYL
jgi:phenazine biosynthesis protein PhzF family